MIISSPLANLCKPIIRWECSLRDQRRQPHAQPSAALEEEHHTLPTETTAQHKHHTTRSGHLRGLRCEPDTRNTQSVTTA